MEGSDVSYCESGQKLVTEEIIALRGEDTAVLFLFLFFLNGHGVPQTAAQ